MKKLIVFSMMLLLISLAGHAQNAVQARKVLDKTARLVGRKGGASADFAITSSKYGNQSGTLAIKGTKFHAKTNQANVWFNGKTQWSYMKKTNEVNVSTPNEAKQMSMNPLKFISMYKNGYNLGMTTTGGNYKVHLTATNQRRSVPEMYITVKKNYEPIEVRMRQGKTWTTIAISNFQAKNLDDKVFEFNSKDFPTAEVVDLR
ncbi:MAG: hypothetical protein LKE41_12750 [Prevotella sp.]|jgi:outer membrane lipoprotein-sorting protein|nr:hypothetical protein [Prevotella sp.]MCI2079919.1 hypothetical protein [Prevotella sp.]MCI2101765.1 hypothetical protein [Prevotella sp.]HCN53689.1 hypothetical protein [Prevotella sp.]